MKICALRSSHFIFGTYSILTADSSFWVVASWFFTVSPFITRFLFNVTLQSVSVLGYIVTGILSSFGDIFIKNVFCSNALQLSRSVRGPYTIHHPLIIFWHKNQFNCCSAFQAFTRLTNTQFIRFIDRNII